MVRVSSISSDLEVLGQRSNSFQLAGGSGCPWSWDRLWFRGRICTANFSSETQSSFDCCTVWIKFLGVNWPFGPLHAADFRQLCVQLQSWIHQTDSSASQMRNVSLLEIYVMFRVSLPGRFPLSTGGRKPGLFDVVKFAADFSYFKNLWRFIFAWADLPCLYIEPCPNLLPSSLLYTWMELRLWGYTFFAWVYRSKTSVFSSSACKAMAALRSFLLATVPFVGPHPLRWAGEDFFDRVRYNWTWWIIGLRKMSVLRNLLRKDIPLQQALDESPPLRGNSKSQDASARNICRDSLDVTGAWLSIHFWPTQKGIYTPTKKKHEKNQEKKASNETREVTFF